ncbi:MAG: FAD-linked oxidase C-terminal domain-containing protein [Opitutaceae bacterium]|nr:FAD-linked oxidase C-terminal domain-containing protein [Opitutaceae bacterium]
MPPAVSPLLQDLQAELPAACLLTDRADLITYAYDGTAAMRQLPLAVVLPLTADQIQATLGIARKHRTPVVTRGSGTGLSGGSIPVANSIVITLVRMDRILELDTRNLTLLVEAGAITQKIYEAADAAGLFYPPDPGSMKISTIGGNVAENSGGLRGLKYGVTRDYVMGMEVILADGKRCWLGSRCVKDVAGYNLRDLFIGSEGTLGIVTQVLLKLLPKPAGRQTLLASFTSMEDAAETVSQIIAARIVPCTLEFLDRKTIQCVENFTRVGLPVDAAALLLIETDGHPAAATEEAQKIEDLCHAHGASSVRRARDSAEAVQLATARRSAFSALARLKPTTILEDVTVPRSELAGMIREVALIAERWNVEIATFGHFGDGNLHPTILTNERDLEEMKRVEHAIDAIVEAALARKGTITGEHGVGLAKKQFLRRQIGDSSHQLLTLVKRSLDPDNLLNPGKIFDLPPFADHHVDAPAH